VASAVGCSEANLSKLETKPNRTPSWPLLIALAKVFNVPLDYFT
jgi:transcriptional regulator with XRE-family HTH domain